MKICIISGNRADRAALIPVAEALIKLLSEPEWIHVDTLPSRDPFDSAISCGQAMMTAAEQLNNLKPDLVILAGDRFEILGGAIAAHLMNIPIAHLSGGDITEGSQDDSMRHAITKLAHIHFVTNEASANIVRSMGEEAWRVHMVGAPQIDFLLSQPLYPRNETLERLGFQNVKVAAPKYVLVAYQPATLAEDPLAEADELLASLKATEFTDGRTAHFIFTTVNTDAYGIEITRKITRFCQGWFEGQRFANMDNEKHRIVNMGNRLFLSAMKHCEYMIGNSSAGYYEAPTLGTKFVNVGSRQNGRTPITGDGRAAERIKVTLEALMTVPRNVLLHKKWGGACTTKPGNESTSKDRGVLTPRKNLSDGYWDDPSYQGALRYSTLAQDKDLLVGF